MNFYIYDVCHVLLTIGYEAMLDCFVSDLTPVTSRLNPRQSERAGACLAFQGKFHSRFQKSFRVFRVLYLLDICLKHQGRKTEPSERDFKCPDLDF
jgi:hypothetical protein